MGEAVKIQIVKEYDPDLLERCRKLDAKVYKEEYFHDFEEESATVRKNPRTRVLGWYKGEVVAYYEYVPLTPAAYQRFLDCDTEVFDLSLSIDDIALWDKNVPADVYVGSIVVAPELQGKMLSLVLVRGLYQALKELEAEGYTFNRVGGTGVSSGGTYSLKTYLDLSFVREVPGGTVMSGPYEKAIAQLETYSW